METILDIAKTGSLLYYTISTLDGNRYINTTIWFNKMSILYMGSLYKVFFRAGSTDV